MIPLGPTSSASIGQTRSLGCQSCELLESCGGVYEGWDCLVQCCNDPQHCTSACFRSKHFVKVVRDAGGLDIERRWQIGRHYSKLPTYIPHILNGYQRSECLPTRHVALTTYDVLSVGSRAVPHRLSSSSGLREHFKISPKAQVLLLSIGKDHRLERYWKYELSQRLPERLASLGIKYVTAPNYSFPLNVPRPEHLVNRRRSLVSAERMSAAGLSVIPHLNAMTQKDWDCWRDFLKDHPQLFFVALEFQTGLRKPSKAKWHLSQLLNLQESLGRKLHLIAVAGRRHLRFCSELPAVTIVDAVPFVRTHKRRRLQQLHHRWVVTSSEIGEPLHALLYHNVRIYAQAVSASLDSLRRLSLQLLSAQDRVSGTGDFEREMAYYESAQLELPFPHVSDAINRHRKSGYMELPFS